MPNYRRAVAPGGTFFFTVVTGQRHPWLIENGNPQRLGNIMREAQSRWPFESIASALLADHMHAVWTLPSGDSDFSKRWAWIKKEMTKAVRIETGEPAKKLWQPRFWEHLIRNQDELNALVDYIHFNPVKHGLVRRPLDWPWSSIHRYVHDGILAPDWGTAFAEQQGLRDLSAMVGE